MFSSIGAVIMAKRLSLEQALTKLSELSSDCSGSDLSDSEDEDGNVQSFSDGSSDEEYQPLAKRIDLSQETLREVASSSTRSTRSRGPAQDRGGARGRCRSGSASKRPTPEEDSKDDENLQNAKNGTAWNLLVPTNNKRGEHNILRAPGGPTRYAKQIIGTTLEAFIANFDAVMLSWIVTFTQEEAHRRGDADFVTSNKEILKLIGLIIARGVIGRGLPLKDLWGKWGPALFGKTMSRSRFLLLLKYLRFDDRNTRKRRLQGDKFALFSDMWNRFIKNCTRNYIPNGFLTVDEQLFPTKVRCRFIQFMKSKPDKFGIKFWLLVDVKSKFLVSGFPYLGKDESRPDDLSLPDYVVRKLLEDHIGKGYNITCDNFFTSMNLAEYLLKQKTSLLGTIRLSRRELPRNLQTIMRKKALFETYSLQSGKCILSAYKCKKNTFVAILSTLHENVTCQETGKKKPNTVRDYNKTKYGVDVIDQMARMYSCKISGRRWPMQVFCNLLDLAVINAHVLYKEVLNVKLSRRKFILQLVEELISSEDPVEQLSAPVANDNNWKRRHCQIDKCNNKCTTSCITCKRMCCGKCRKAIDFVCKNC